MCTCYYCNPQDLIVVSGDTLEVFFEIEKIPVEEILKINFIANKAGIQAECRRVDNTKTFYLKIDKKDTAEAKSIFCGYDLTAEFKNGDILTLVHNGFFGILKKRNTLISEFQKQAEG